MNPAGDDVEKAKREADEAIAALRARAKELGHDVPPSFDSLCELIERGSNGDGMFIPVQTLNWIPVGRSNHLKGFEPPSSARFFCGSERCGRVHEHRLTTPTSHLTTIEPPVSGQCIVLNYVCRYCDASHSILLRMDENPSNPAGNWWTIKAGEWPRTALPVPRTLQNLATGQVGLLKQGYRAEADGYGIGAFTYYRRVVEDLRNEIFQRILNISQDGGASEAAMAQIKSAIADPTFAGGMRKLAGAIPVELMIDGKNVLALLFGAISTGVHGLSDKECLERAETVREALEQFAARLDYVLKEPAKLRKTVGKLEKISLPSREV